MLSLTGFIASSMALKEKKEKSNSHQTQSRFPNGWIRDNGSEAKHLYIIRNLTVQGKRTDKAMSVVVVTVMIQDKDRDLYHMKFPLSFLPHSIIRVPHQLNLSLMYLSGEKASRRHREGKMESRGIATVPCGGKAL